MLNDYQFREYRRFKQMLTFFGLNALIYALYQPFADEVALFTSNFNILDGLIPNKDTISTGITTSKESLKTSISTMLSLICTSTKAYAIKIGNATLQAQMNFRASAISKVTDSDLKGFVQQVVALVTPLLTDPLYTPYGTDQAALDAVTKMAGNFNDMIGQAQISDSTNTVASQKIDEAIKTIDENIVQFDLLIDYFLASNSGFVAGYHINSQVDNSGIHHSGSEGLITSAATGLPIINATFKLLNTNKSTTTDLNGHYQLIRVPTGEFQAQVSAPGFTTQTIVLHINRGRIGTLNIAL